MKKRVRLYPDRTKKMFVTNAADTAGQQYRVYRNVGGNWTVDRGDMPISVAPTLDIAIIDIELDLQENFGWKQGGRAP